MLIRNKNRIHIFLTFLFFIAYFVSFYVLQASSPVEIKKWYTIDSIMTGLSGFGLLVLLYNTYKKLKYTLTRK